MSKTDKHDERCPNCGRFVEHDGDGFYDRLEWDNDLAPIKQFCDQKCADAYHYKTI